MCFGFMKDHIDIGLSDGFLLGSHQCHEIMLDIFSSLHQIATTVEPPAIAPPVVAAPAVTTPALTPAAASASVATSSAPALGAVEMVEVQTVMLPKSIVVVWGLKNKNQK